MRLENQILSPSNRPNDRQARRPRRRFAESTRGDGLGDGGGTADCRGTACPLNARLLTYLKQPVRTAEATRSHRMAPPTLKALLVTLQQLLRLVIPSRNTLPQEELPPPERIRERSSRPRDSEFFRTTNLSPRPKNPNFPLANPEAIGSLLN